MSQNTDNSTFSFPALYDQTSSRPASTRTNASSSDQNLLDGSYSTFDDTSVGSIASSPSQESTSSWLHTLKAPRLPPLTNDSSLPFTSSSHHRHATWAQTFYSRPEQYIHPCSVEEVQKAVLLARRKKRRLVTVGSGHSPSDLTCTSSWMLNLGKMNRILDLKTYSGDFRNEEKHSSGGQSVPSRDKKVLNRRYAGRVLVQAGISLKELNEQAKAYGLTIPNLGSIHIQSIAGAIATATHGSSTQHGLLSQSVRGLRIVTSGGDAIWCSPKENEELFRASLVSLGALGIITELEFELAPDVNIYWQQSLTTLDDFLHGWNQDLWTQAEFVRCWWMPYIKKVVVWKADKTNSPVREPDQKYYTGALGFYIYHSLLTLSYFFPRLLPTVEWFVMGMEYGFGTGKTNSAIAPLREGLLMDCLYSQFVNEWALPLEKGPELMTRLSKWLHGDQEGSGIPFSPKNLWVHAPIEVRVSNGSGEENQPRPFLDPTSPNGPTLYINATLYRPHGLDPPCRVRYYQAFEWLMKQLGGRPHWAKNFSTVTKEDLHNLYGEDMDKWLRTRRHADPDGLFVGAWHRRLLLGDDEPPLSCEETEIDRKLCWGGGLEWTGKQAR